MSSEDNVRIDPRLIGIVFDSIDSVCKGLGIEFMNMDLEQKKGFLTEHGKEVVATAMKLAGPLARRFRNKAVFIVENEGNAGLYFMKVDKDGE